MVNELLKVPTGSPEEVEKSKTELLNKNLGYLEAQLNKTGTGFLVGDSVTWLDLYLVIVLDSLLDKKEKILSIFPAIKKADEKVRALPKIATWIAKRPVTVM